MGILEILTIIFIVLKLIGIINWSWVLILLPELIMVGMYILIIIISIMMNIKIGKDINKFNKKF